MFGEGSEFVRPRCDCLLMCLGGEPRGLFPSPSVGASLFAFISVGCFTEGHQLKFDLRRVQCQ